MVNKDFNKIGEKHCNSLEATYSNGFWFRGPLKKYLDFNYNDSIIHVEINQARYRTITLTSSKIIKLSEISALLFSLEKLLMLFEGRFFTLIKLNYEGQKENEKEYDLYSTESLNRRLAYYETDSCHYLFNPEFLNFYDYLSPNIIEKWLELESDLDIVHQVVLYNLSKIKLPCDAKCAYLIQSFESMVELIKKYDSELLCNLPPEKQEQIRKLQTEDSRKISIINCIEAVITNFGTEIFSLELNNNQGEFFKILKNTRHRIMHIKRNQQDKHLTGDQSISNQQDKYLTGEQSILYLVKISYLYRIILLKILGIDLSLYKHQLLQLVNKWNNYNGILANFLLQLNS